jgi:nucleotide-binding universal stress UspA family protein
MTTPRRGFRSVVLGVDGSPHSRRAAAFLARLTPAAGGRVIAVWVVEPVRVPSLALLPASIRGRIAGEFARHRHAVRAAAQRSLDAAARTLERAGWRVRTIVREGIPLPVLLDTVRTEGADVLVLGGRGTSRLEGLLLGSTAEGALKRSPVPVLIVK